jgi:hypothetical protein
MRFGARPKRLETVHILKGMKTAMPPNPNDRPNKLAAIEERMKRRRERAKPPTVRSLDMPPGLITRRTLLLRTGVSESVLRRMEQVGQVRADFLNATGWAYYREERIQTVIEWASRERNLPPPARSTRPDPPPSPPARASRSERAELASPPPPQSPLDDVEPAAPPPPKKRAGAGYTPAEAANVFGLMEAGKTLVQIVIKTSIDPVVVREIADQHAAFSGSVTVTLDHLEKMRRLVPDGAPLKSGDDLYALVRAATRRLVCPRCREAERADACVPCLVLMAQKEQQRAEGASAPAEPKDELDDLAREDPELERERLAKAKA